MRHILTYAYILSIHKIQSSSATEGNIGKTLSQSYPSLLVIFYFTNFINWKNLIIKK